MPPIRPVETGLAGSGLQLLEQLVSLGGPLASYVSAFLHAEDRTSQRWVDDYFRVTTRKHFEMRSDTAGVPPSAEELARLTASPSSRVEEEVRLIGVQPHYFRGFLALGGPALFTAPLVVVYGRNSAGKTSLAEALEWLITGTLERRKLGDARELERCVGNQFRPEGEKTWVEAIFEVGSERLRLRRELVEDFGSTQASRCVSRLFLNGRLQNPEEERSLLLRLFAGVAPLLMQHTLRSFVQSSPSARRDYFERLLQLDGVTRTIEAAVVGDSRLDEFPSDRRDVYIARWKAVGALLDERSARRLQRTIARAPVEELRQVAISALLAVARERFRYPVGEELPAMRERCSSEQEAARKRSFPMLAEIRPRKEIDEATLHILEGGELRVAIGSFIEAVRVATSARSAQRAISEAQVAVARATKLMENAGLVSLERDSQRCPVCRADPPTLSRARLREIRSWEPAVAALLQAERAVRDSSEHVRAALRGIWSALDGTFPHSPPEQEWAAAIANVPDDLRQAAIGCKVILTDAGEWLHPFREWMREVGMRLKSEDVSAAPIEALENAEEVLRPLLTNAATKAKGYRRALEELENLVGTRAEEDPEYAAKALWLDAGDNVDALLEDLRWEKAKKIAQAELEAVRDALIRTRANLLEQRQAEFNDGMRTVWAELRSDSHSSFGALVVPPPRGRGFPVSIEVKAQVNGPDGPQQVDALRVFSESQVHVLGIAAFVTRARLLHQRVVIFDDPVQSMDEDHFRTFAGRFLRTLIDEGRQVIVLTHNQTFEKCLSFEHAEDERYVTLNMSHTRRKGCRLEEGNRRVAERLYRAEKKVEEGDLVSAWNWIRQAIERLYTVLWMKHGPEGFDPMSWSSATADEMWNAGVGGHVISRDPEIARQLKLYLDLTVGGAHDAERAGETDARNAIQLLRRLLNDWRLGG